MQTTSVVLVINTNEGEPIFVSEDEAMQVPLFHDILQYTHHSDETLNIEVPFSTATISTYFKWIENNEITNEMEWTNLIDLFLFANFINCEKYKSHFVLNMIENVLIDENVLTIRYLLSMTRDHAYLTAESDNDNHLFDPLEAFDNNDYLLSYVKLEDLLVLFRRLPMYAQQKLHQSFPRNHQYRQHLFNEIFHCREYMYGDEEDEE